MNNFINITDYDASIHREILDALLREDAANSDTVEVCENRAIAKIRSLIGKRYDCDQIFAAEGDQRNQLVLSVALDIAIYEIFCQHNPYKMSDIRKERYKDAMDWLREVRDYDANIEGAPLLPEETLNDNSPWQIESDRQCATHF